MSGEEVKRSFGGHLGIGILESESEKGGRNMKWEKYFPPGYPYEMERNGAGLLLLLGTALSLSFFGKLYSAAGSLYEYKNGARVLREGALAVPFRRLAAEHWSFYLPFLLFLAVTAVFHSIYYHQKTKSIYLMKRLPRRWAFLKTCVQAPLLGLCAGAVLAGALYLLYYGSYLLVIPGECLP